MSASGMNQPLQRLDASRRRADDDIPIVMLDSTLRIRRFNPGAQKALNLIPTDIGRQMSDMTMTLLVDGFEKLILDVIETLEVREVEVRDRAGRTCCACGPTLIDVDGIRKKGAGSA